MDKPLNQAERLQITFDSYLVRVNALIKRTQNVRMLYADDYGSDVLDYFDSIVEDLKTYKSELEAVINEINENIALGYNQIQGAQEDFWEDSLAKVETLLFGFEKNAKILSNPPLKEGTYEIGEDISDDSAPLGPLN